MSYALLSAARVGRHLDPQIRHTRPVTAHAPHVAPPRSVCQRDSSHVRPSRARWFAAWGVHTLTASGVVWGFAALLAIGRDEYRWAFAYLMVATAIDAINGTLARWVRAKDVLPSFDGTLLDNLIDYLNYALVPAMLLHEAQLLPTSCALLGSASVCLASAYQFCQADAKTSDHFFVGFPSYWNVLAFYFFITELDLRVNLGIVACCVLFVFIPVKWVYPSRTEKFRSVTVTATAIWAILCIVMLMQYPTPTPWLLPSSLVYVIYYIGISVFLNLSAKRTPLSTSSSP